MRRLCEYFGSTRNNAQYTVSNYPRKLYRQERDWTCSLACLRTIMSGVTKEVPSEKELIDKYVFVPGLHYTREIKDKKILQDYDAVYSVGFKSENIKIGMLGVLLSKGYYVMVEAMYNYAQWFVVLGYCALGNETDLERHKLLVYDPYYDDVRLLNVDEFFAMWCDKEGVKGHQREFVAIRRSLK